MPERTALFSIEGTDEYVLKVKFDYTLTMSGHRQDVSVSIGKRTINKLPLSTRFYFAGHGRDAFIGNDMDMERCSSGFCGQTIFSVRNKSAITLTKAVFFENKISVFITVHKDKAQEHFELNYEMVGKIRIDFDPKSNSKKIEILEVYGDRKTFEDMINRN